MAGDNVPDDVKALWKEADMDQPMFSPDQFREETEKMQARRRKGAMVTAASMALFVVCYTLALFCIPNNTLTRIGSILSVLVCGIWLVDILLERARVAADPGETDSARFYRAELERARRKHRSLVWRFALLAVPFILWDVGFSQIFAKVAWFVAPFMWFDCVVLLVVFTIVGPLKQLKLARKCQDRIDALEGVLGHSDR